MAPASIPPPIGLPGEPPHMSGLSVVGAVTPGGGDAFQGIEAWSTQQVTRRFDTGLVISLGEGMGMLSTAALLGRYRMVDDARFKLGLDLQIGFYSGSIAAPMAVRLGERFWVYSSPTYSYLKRLPVGVIVPLGSRLMLTAETGVLLGAPNKTEFVLPYASVGLAVRYGKAKPPKQRADGSWALKR